MGVVLVSSKLIYSHLKNPKLRKMFNLLEKDTDVQTYLSMANTMAVKRLMYNDHGPVHSRIVAGTALEIADIISEKVSMSVVKDGDGDLVDSQLVTLCGAYLHDVGNAVHRELHHIHGCLLAEGVLERLLPVLYKKDRQRMLRLKQEILHCIFSSEENLKCLSVEAGIVKVADGLDMAEGRARVPYEIGKVDIHSLSALSIKSVEICKGGNRPLKILVKMSNPAGVFQIEEILQQKIRTSGIQELIEIVALQNGVEIKTTATRIGQRYSLGRG
ncbi:HD domain-containing protein [Candidatus Hecatella orcuttiae]|uniref:HD domain-containing protein n=1 Tax=Candidatus Hecatella orcuttiae TaxID=1935119 RepID=UPI002868096E|nr:HD domain-containing protein [Candidatus Hecatella orcuttiae]